MIEAHLDPVDLRRLNETLNRIDPTSSRGKEVYKRALTMGALVIERRIKENISGRILKVQTGRLRSSIGSLIKSTEALIGSGARQGEPVSYSAIHEFGGMAGHARIPARRYMSRSLAEVINKVGEVMIQEVEKEIR